MTVGSCEQIHGSPSMPLLPDLSEHMPADKDQLMHEYLSIKFTDSFIASLFTSPTAAVLYLLPLSFSTFGGKWGFIKS